MALDRKNISPEKLRELLAIVNTHQWIEYNKITLGHALWQLRGHEYQVDPLCCDAKEQVYKKGAQIGFTELRILKTLHKMITGAYPVGKMYLFPTANDVRDFSRARFNPLILSNPVIQAAVKQDAGSTDSQTIKKIGTGHLYLRGARATKDIGGSKKTSSQLKSAPVDALDFDERDEMDDDMVQLALERVSHSSIQDICYLGTPTIPDYGVDKLYQESDQRCWFIKCRKCGGETCLELEFPDCLKERADGSVYRACIKCGEEIHPRNGHWVALYPDRDMVGWWISQLNSVFVEPKKILNMFRNPPNGNLSEVYNSKLGMAYIEAENRLKQNDVLNCCGKDPMSVEDDGPCCMGVDVGKNLHVVIGKRPSDSRIKVVKMVRVESFNDVHDLAAIFNVRCAVIDIKPETRKVREFQKEEKYEVLLCDYSESQRGGPQINEKEKTVVVNRTEILDATHDLVVSAGHLELPRLSEEVRVFAKEMCATAKVLVENEVSGSKVYRYKGKLGGPDDYRHAMNYCLLASERIGLSQGKRSVAAWLNRGRRKRTFMSV